MTRIAHVTAPAQFGGLERVVADLTRECAARGHDVMLVMVLDSDAPVPAWARDLGGVRVEAVRLRARAYLRERRAVRALLADHGSQVLHTHGFRADVVHVGVGARARVPTVSTAHGFASVDSRGRFYEWLQLRAWRRFDAVVAVSTPLLATLEGAGVPASRLVMIRNGLAPSAAALDVATARARLGLPSEGPIVGWVGRFSAEKDPLLAVEAFARTARTDAVLCMLGDGPLRDECAQRAAALGIVDRVRLPGSVPDAGPLLRAFDLLLLSSRTEGTPMVVLEAAWAGVPVVATAVGGVPDVLGKDGGWLAPAEDPERLAATLQDAIEGREGRGRAAALRERVFGRHGEPDWVDRYLGLYERLRTK